MAIIRTARDNGLLDAIDAIAPEILEGTVWRAVRDGRDPVQCSAVGGRWDDRTFDVLYTSTTADGAAQEMYFHLSRGQPVIPSQVRYRLFELRAALSSALNFPSLANLQAVGLQTAGFGQLSCAERGQEYPRTQEIAEAAYFLGRDGLIVPSARSGWPNVVVFCDPAGPEAVEVVNDRGLIDWTQWRKEPFGY
ncbi:MAG: RES domain-containing protein [Acetobacteraceae bacterium]|nr:RES domain-containing protein [Acetobacteraceae bacterium]